TVVEDPMRCVIRGVAEILERGDKEKSKDEQRGGAALRLAPGETMPGYWGRRQAAKLGLKPEMRVGLHRRPDGWALTDPPAGLTGPDPDGHADVIIAFFTQARRPGAGGEGPGPPVFPAPGRAI